MLTVHHTGGLHIHIEPVLNHIVIPPYTSNCSIDSCCALCYRSGPSETRYVSCRGVNLPHRLHFLGGHVLIQTYRVINPTNDALPRSCPSPPRPSLSTMSTCYQLLAHSPVAPTVELLDMLRDCFPAVGPTTKVSYCNPHFPFCFSSFAYRDSIWAIVRWVK